jgi:predicted DNA-binding transcriptional regulator AlpA
VTTNPCVCDTCESATAASAANGLSYDVLEPVVARVAELIADRVVERLADLEVVPAEDAWRLLKLVDAAERLGRSERWIRERVRRGELPYVRLDGGALAFLLEDIRLFAEARRISADRPVALAGRLQGGGNAASGAGTRGGHQPPELGVARGD